MVLEMVPARLAGEITRLLKVCATIGIGAGLACDGQVLVLHDMLGLGRGGHAPRFVRRYEELGDRVVQAARSYCDEVRSGAFPAADHSFPMPDKEWAAFAKGLRSRPRRRS